MNNSKTIFLDNNLNYDIEQCKDLKNNKSKLDKSYNSNNNNNNLNTLIEAKEYIGCIGNKCSLLKEEKINNELINKKMFNFNNSNFNNSNFNNSNFNNSNFSKNNNIISNIIEFIYLVIVVFLLMNCFLYKNIHNLIHILIISIVFIFYKIYINF
tara:strand:- start:643 stop:1107 length:465 start_codon:yes stop_codon:yes gene_type:complete